MLKDRKPLTIWKGTGEKSQNNSDSTANKIHCSNGKVWKIAQKLSPLKTFFQVPTIHNFRNQNHI